MTAIKEMTHSELVEYAKANRKIIDAMMDTIKTMTKAIKLISKRLETK